MLILVVLKCQWNFDQCPYNFTKSTLFPLPVLVLGILISVIQGQRFANPWYLYSLVLLLCKPQINYNIQNFPSLLTSLYMKSFSSIQVCSKQYIFYLFLWLDSKPVNINHNTLPLFVIGYMSWFHIFDILLIATKIGLHISFEINAKK